MTLVLLFSPIVIELTDTDYLTVVRRFTMSELVPRYDLDIKQGATRTFSITVLDNNNSAIVLTGYSAKLEIRDRPGGKVISSLTSSSGITITEATGVVAVLWTAAQTAAMTFDRAVYDLYLTSASGVVTYVLEGDVILDKRVTQ